MPIKLLSIVASRLRANPVNFIVKSLRAAYVSGSSLIVLAWYTGWRNERVAAGDHKIPIPGLSKLRASGHPDRPDASAPNLFGGGPFGGGGGTPGSPVQSGSSPLFPTGQKFQWGRVDQGIDVDTVPGGKVLAIFDGWVSYAAPDPGGFGAPAYPLLHVTSGPLNGKIIYYGHVVPIVHNGARVKQGTPIATTRTANNPSGNGGPGHLEVGMWPPGTMGSGGTIGRYIGFSNK